jgi:hypothetical protein
MPSKEAKVHLNKGGLPLCVCDARMKDFERLRYELTMKFDEVTCRSCKAAISKLSRVQGYASA